SCLNPTCEVNVDTVQLLELDEQGEARASLDTMLLALVEAQGSDLHLTVGAPPRVRVFGKLVALPEYDHLEPTDTETLIRAACTGEQWARFEADHELDFAYSIKGISRFRVNVYLQRGSIGAAFRAIPHEIKSLEDLGVPDAVAR